MSKNNIFLSLLFFFVKIIIIKLTRSIISQMVSMETRVLFKAESIRRASRRHTFKFVSPKKRKFFIDFQGFDRWKFFSTLISVIYSLTVQFLKTTISIYSTSYMTIKLFFEKTHTHTKTNTLLYSDFVNHWKFRFDTKTWESFISNSNETEEKKKWTVHYGFLFISQLTNTEYHYCKCIWYS